MYVNPKNGIDDLLFGMSQADVRSRYGEPNKSFLDEEENSIWVYNALQLRLTFYADEQFRLGYMITSNPAAEVLQQKVIGQAIQELKASLPFKTWEQEDFDTTENHFNESNWLILQAEFGHVIRLELGAIIKDDESFEWKFGPK
jgi:hypothetical protein